MLRNASGSYLGSPGGGPREIPASPSETESPPGAPSGAQPVEPRCGEAANLWARFGSPFGSHRDTPGLGSKTRALSTPKCRSPSETGLHTLALTPPLHVVNYTDDYSVPHFEDFLRSTTWETCRTDQAFTILFTVSWQRDPPIPLPVHSERSVFSTLKGCGYGTHPPPGGQGRLILTVEFQAVLVTTQFPVRRPPRES